MTGQQQGVAGLRALFSDLERSDPPSSGPVLDLMPYGAPMLSAVVFDVDGTLADTERDGHRPAFNAAFAAHGLDHDWDVETYGRLLSVPGGRSRIESFLAGCGHVDAADLARRVHATKTELFVEWVRSGPVEPRAGVRELLADLRREGIRTGVATTGRRSWVEPLLDRLFGHDTFEVLVTGDDVARLKPDPEAYTAAVDALGLDPATVLAVEDSPPGCAAARAAALCCVVVTNDYTRDGRFPGAAEVLDGFESLDARRCAALCDDRA